MHGRRKGWYESKDGKIARASRMLDLSMADAMAVVERETEIFLRYLDDYAAMRLRDPTSPPAKNLRLAAMRFAEKHARDQLIVCVECGTEFLPRMGNARFCSNACYRAKVNRGRAHPPPPRQCVICGSTFSTSQAGKRACSPDCKKQLRASYRKRQPKPDARTCVVCGDVFQSVRDNDRMYCSIRCNKKAAYRRSRQPDPSAAGSPSATRRRGVTTPTPDSDFAAERRPPATFRPAPRNDPNCTAAKLRAEVATPAAIA